MAATVHAVLWFASLFPRVESPLPSQIGLSFPFTVGGAGGIFRDLVRSGRSQPVRRWASIEFGRLGFAFGGIVYCVALIAQLVFPI